MYFDGLPRINSYIKMQDFFMRNIAWVLSALIYSSSFIPSVSAQSESEHDCDKYCFASCNEYFPGPEFSPCVRATVNCNCHSKASMKNPFVIFGLGILIVVGVVMCCVCEHRHRCFRDGVPRSAVVAEPVVPNPAYPAANHTNNAYFYPPRSSGSPSSFLVNPAAPPPTTQYGFGMTAQPMAMPRAPPVVSPQKPPLPEEYNQPPPAYNEAVRNSNYPHY